MLQEESALLIWTYVWRPRVLKALGEECSNGHIDVLLKTPRNRRHINNYDTEQITM